MSDRREPDQPSEHAPGEPPPASIEDDAVAGRPIVPSAPPPSHRPPPSPPVARIEPGPGDRRRREPSRLTRVRFYTVLTAVVVIVILPTLLYVGLSWRPSSSDQRALPEMRVVSYYPSTAAWSYMWTRFDWPRIAADFRRAHELGFDTVRIFVPPAAFGFPKPSPVMQRRLRAVVAAADAADMHVGLALFDRYEGYSDRTNSERWLRAILKPYTDDSQIAFVEVHNEIDPTKSTARAWYSAMMRTARDTGLEAPLIASVPGRTGVAGLRELARSLGTSQPDAYSLHYYSDPAYLETTLRRAQAAVAPTPLILGEVGYSTAAANQATPGTPATTWAQEARQSLVLRTAFVATRRLALPPPGIWTLYDFAPGAIPHDVARYGRGGQQSFGLLHADGTPKPAAADVSSYLTRNTVSTDVNADFSNGGTTRGAPQPADWRALDTSQGSLSWDSQIGHDAPGSIRLSGTGGSAGRVPSYYQQVWSIEVRPHQTFRLSVWARGINVAGNDRIAIAWFDANGKYLGQKESKGLPPGDPDWTRLVVHSNPPHGAVALEVHLKSSHETGAVWFDDVSIS